MTALWVAGTAIAALAWTLYAILFAVDHGIGGWVVLPIVVVQFGIIGGSLLLRERLQKGTKP